MPIQKSAGNIETFTLGGSLVETHDATAIATTHTEFITNVFVATFTDGTPATNSFATFPRAKSAFLNIDMTTGNWRTSAGTSGTLSAGQLTALNANQKNLKNGIENLANAIGLTPGTIVAWQ